MLKTRQARTFKKPKGEKKKKHFVTSRLLHLKTHAFKYVKAPKSVVSLFCNVLKHNKEGIYQFTYFESMNYKRA